MRSVANRFDSVDTTGEKGPDSVMACNTCVLLNLLNTDIIIAPGLDWSLVQQYHCSNPEILMLSGDCICCFMPGLILKQNIRRASKRLNIVSTVL